MIETICIVAAIIMVILFTPWIVHITGLFVGVIPQSILAFAEIALVIKFILFVIHRGS